MKSPVIIKGNNMGIKLIIASDSTISDISNELRKKLQNTGQYYKNIRPITVTFEGKELTDEEKEFILDTLRDIGLNILTLQDKAITTNEKTHNIPNDTDGLFYIGNLYNGQSIDASSSIVIVGNIDVGASVFSEGNIIIIGTLNGYAEAGCKGNKDAFVYSFNIKED